MNLKILFLHGISIKFLFNNETLLIYCWYKNINILIYIPVFLSINIYISILNRKYFNNHILPIIQ